MYYGGGEEEAYSNAMLGYYMAFILGPIFLIAAIILLVSSRNHKKHRVLLQVFGIFSLIFALLFGIISFMQSRPRCCGEGYIYMETTVVARSTTAFSGAMTSAPTLFKTA